MAGKVKKAEAPKKVVSPPKEEVRQAKTPRVLEKKEEAPKKAPKKDAYEAYQESWSADHRWTNEPHSPDIHKKGNKAKLCNMCDTDVKGFGG